MTTPGPTSTPLVEATHVSFAYGRDVLVLDDVSLSVGASEFVALVGPNGSGKSTLLRVLLGLLKPTSGEVRLFGQAPDDLDRRWRLGYVSQRPSFPDDLPATVEEVVATGRLPKVGWRRRLTKADREKVDHAIDAVGLCDFRRTKVGELSGGQQQRAFIAKALAGDPELLVLDEPVAGVDRESQERFATSLTHLVDHHDAAVLLVSHELGAVAEHLDRVIVLKRSVVFDGPAADLAATGVSLGVHHDDLPLWLEGLR
jgi:zinc transport system ATP-binding protein